METELAEEWVLKNSGYSTKNFHGKKAMQAFLAGYKAAKKRQYHFIKNKDFPAKNGWYLCYLQSREYEIIYWNIYARAYWESSGNIIAWCELPEEQKEE